MDLDVCLPVRLCIRDFGFMCVCVVTVSNSVPVWVAVRSLVARSSPVLELLVFLEINRIASYALPQAVEGLWEPHPIGVVFVCMRRGATWRQTADSECGYGIGWSLSLQFESLRLVPDAA